MESTDFSFFQLLRDIHDRRHHRINSWRGFECFIEELCRRQDPYLERQENKYPDIILSSGEGVEAKYLTDRCTKSVNLNSTCPRKTYYTFAFCNEDGILHACIVHGFNYFSPDIDTIQESQKGTRTAENPMLKYRTRLMWEVESPFKVYSEGFFLVDRAGGIIKL